MEGTNTTSNKEKLLPAANNQSTPKNQALVIQNTNPELPIQLRIDPVTDYTALSITVVVSIVTAFLSAIVTILLVTRSNTKLIENQNLLTKLQIENQLKQQQNEVKSRNRQEWINTVRKLLSDYLVNSGELLLNLLNSENSRLLFNQNKVTAENFVKMSEIMRKNITSLNNNAMLINLTLSKDNPLDREIYDLTQLVSNSYISLAQTINDEINKGVIVSIIEFDYLNKFSEKDIILRTNVVFAEKAKILLKNEWERLKNLD